MDIDPSKESEIQPEVFLEPAPALSGEPDLGPSPAQPAPALSGEPDLGPSPAEPAPARTNEPSAQPPAEPADPLTADNLRQAGVYSVFLRSQEDGRHRYFLTKIVHLDENVVHLVVLSPDFAYRPDRLQAEQSKASLPGDIEEARSRHMSVSRRLFSLMLPVFCYEEAATDRELNGYRRWKILDTREVADAPSQLPGFDGKSAAWRIFLFSGVPFGLLQAAWHYYIDGLTVALLVLPLSTIIFGGGMVLTQRYFVRRRLQKSGNLGKGWEDSAMSAYQMAETQLALPFSAVFSRALGALAQLKGSRIILKDQAGTIEAEVKEGFSSEGQSVSISIYSVGLDRAGVVVRSVPRKGGELDLGKNHENVQSILNFLKEGV